jgi:hypothetical protein
VGREAPQAPQNRKPPGLSCPQTAQRGMREVYGSARDGVGCAGETRLPHDQAGREIGPRPPVPAAKERPDVPVVPQLPPVLEVRPARPDGIRVRTFDREADARAVHRLVQDAFADIGNQPPRSFEFTLYRRGDRQVFLDVDSENRTGATRLYERAGMRVEHRWDYWVKRLA